MGRGSGSKASAGCGAFGLVGVLMTMGIVAWLLVTSTGSITSRARRPTTTTSPTEAPVPVTVAVTPNDGLGADPDVTVTANGWAPNSEVAISTCLGGAGPVLGGKDPCDADATALVMADAAGVVEVTYRVDRIVTAGGLPYDCADGGITCAVRTTGQAVDGRPATGQATVAFQVDLPAPDLLDEYEG